MAEKAVARAGAKNPVPRSAPAPPADTICGIATPPGDGGIGIIRISGEKAFELASRIVRFSNGKSPAESPSHTLHHAAAVSPASGERIDEVMVGLLRAPRTYTREDTVEVYCHGGGFLLRKILGLFVEAGCRLARPGEFTERAFLNGRIDLTQAEAVMDLIAAKSEAARRAALGQMEGGLFRPISGLRQDLLALLAEVEAGLDFTEEDIEFVSGPEISQGLERAREVVARLLSSSKSGRVVREGFRVVIAGSPNVGKSSLLNALLETRRAIVSPHPGTTRDLVEDRFLLGGLVFHMVDTAGLRDSGNPVELEGIKRARQAHGEADLVLVVLDAHACKASSGLLEEDLRQWKAAMKGRPHLVVLNKIDLLEDENPLRDRGKHPNSIPVSALTGEGISEIKNALLGLVEDGTVRSGEGEALINERHKEALLGAGQALNAALEALKGEAPYEVLAMELRNGINRLGEITGENTTEGLLDRIFSRFCIGK